MGMMKRFIALFFGVWLLFACSTRPPVDSSATAAQSILLRQHGHWLLNGRIAIRTPETQWQADVRWEQQGESYTINLAGPMGQGSAQVQGDPKGIKLTTAQGEVFHEQTPEILWQKQMGWLLPLSGLRYWVLGISSLMVGVDAQEWVQGRLKYLQQDGWSIDYRRYQSVTLASGSVQVPNKLFLTNDAIEIRMVIHHWQFL